MSFIKRLEEFWYSLGMLGPCLVMFFLGALILLGFIFGWEWLAPKKQINYSPGIRRPLTLVAGILLIVASLVFYFV